MPAMSDYNVEKSLIKIYRKKLAYFDDEKK